jgi:hypothetical protein
MSVYTKHSATPLSQTDIHLYGRRRLGINNLNIDVTANAIMINRLKDIKAGKLKPTETDVNFMNH